MTRLTQRLGLTRFDADEHYKRALQAYEKRNLEDAILEMEYAIELLPTEAEYYAARGFFYLEDSINDKAKADFEQALKLYPYETLAHYGRGVMAYKSRNWDEALAHFADAYRADPNRPETLYYLALVYHRQNQNAQALALMQRAQAIFEQSNDRRRTDASRWVRALEKLVQQAQLEEGNQPSSTS
jgi:beta-barrel assembly-enhancing protease